MNVLDGMILACFRCLKRPADLVEYIKAGKEYEMTPDEYVWGEEGTLNRQTGWFACTNCYVEIGAPSSEKGWTAPHPTAAFMN